WFGNLSNGPSPESTQKEEAQAVIDSLDADLYAFQEISDAALLQQIADDLPEYELVVNFANVSNPPDEPGVSQKLAFLYRTSVITPLETKGLLASIHPSYNGGDASALVGFPDPNPSRFYASGRLPFLMVADVNLNGVTERVNFINLHARANSSNDALGRYNMRRYDVTVLKDTLDAFYADQNVVLLGDYNDDVDETVADVDTTLTSYDAYVNDPDNYAIKTIALSNAGFRSFAFRENMIDHIGITNELFDNYIDGSEIVHYEFFDSDYAETTSDHFPVSASFNFEQEITFNDFTAVEVVSFNQGRKRNGRPVHRFRSNPNKALGRPLENYYFNFVSLGFGGDIVLKLDNFMYDLPGDEFKVFESTFGRWNIPCHWYPEKAEVFVSEDGVDFTSLGIACQDGKFDLAGSGVDKALFIKIKDVSDPRLFRGFADGYDLDGIYNLIQEPQANGRRATLEDHDNFVQNEVGEFQVSTYPNPFTDYVELEIFSEGSSTATVRIFNTIGREVYNTELALSEGYQNARIELSKLTSGVYLMKIDDTELGIKQTVKIVKK
ncbi:MAG: T9SS type A sorting domain-containing protein, partial [Bacteroidota bacterium]